RVLELALPVAEDRLEIAPDGVAPAGPEALQEPPALAVGNSRPDALFAQRVLDLLRKAPIVDGLGVQRLEVRAEEVLQVPVRQVDEPFESRLLLAPFGA